MPIRFVPKQHQEAARRLRVLYRHFLARLVRGGTGAEVDDPGELGLAALLGMMAVPGMILSLMLMDKYATMPIIMRRTGLDAATLSIPDKYFFIVYSMTVTGLITVWRWTAILPDRQDYQNLAPLPVGPRTFLTANVLAVLSLAGLFAVTINAASMLLFPVVVTASKTNFSAFFTFAAYHASAVVVASLLSFLAVFSIMGLVVAVTPGRLLAAATLVTRVSLVVGLLALLLSGANGGSLVRQFQADPDGWLRLLPPVWYVAQFQVHQGSESAAFGSAARMAYLGVGGAFGLAVLAYALSSRRTYLRAAQETGAGGLAARVGRCPLPALGRTAFERAGFRFALRVLLRSEAHALCVGGFLGLGLLLGLQRASALPAWDAAGPPPAAFLAIPLVVSFLLICGLWLAFEMPAAARANWVFRGLAEVAPFAPSRLAALLLRSAVTVIVIVPCLVATWWITNAQTALLHALFVAVMSFGVIELLTFRYRKAPFTCAMPMFRNRLLPMALGAVVLFGVVVDQGSRVEAWMLADPVRFIWLVIGHAGWWLWRRIRDVAGDWGDRLVFEEELAPVVQPLRLISPEG